MLCYPLEWSQTILLNYSKKCVLLVAWYCFLTTGKALCKAKALGYNWFPPRYAWAVPLTALVSSTHSHTHLLIKNVCSTGQMPQCVHVFIFKRFGTDVLCLALGIYKQGHDEFKAWGLSCCLSMETGVTEAGHRPVSHYEKKRWTVTVAVSQEAAFLLDLSTQTRKKHINPYMLNIYLLTQNWCTCSLLDTGQAWDKLWFAIHSCLLQYSCS